MGGLRIDCCIRIQNKTLWIDNSATHISCKSVRSRVYNMLTNEVLEGVGAYEVSTPPVMQRAKNKHAKYLPMAHRASLQRINGLRTDTVFFRPAVMSHTGELCKDLLQCIEDLAMEAKRQCIASPPPFGVTPAQASARFRTRLKDDLAATMARGFGGMLRAVGFPTNKNAASADDAVY